MKNNVTNKEIVIVIIVLVVAVVLFAFKYFSAHRQLQKLETLQTQAALNEKIISFASMFVKDVLKAEEEVSFETRLKLENAVRELQDDEIMADWQKFTESRTEREAQDNVKELLEDFLDKIHK